MTYKQISQMLETVGLPYAYYQFPNDTPQAPPFLIFYFENSDDVYADNRNYQRITELTIEFYSDTKDFFYEALIEDTLNANGLTYTKDEQFLDSEHMHETVYEMEVLVQTDWNLLYPNNFGKKIC